jgi:hypothetical protein
MVTEVHLSMPDPEALHRRTMQSLTLRHRLAYIKCRARISSSNYKMWNNHLTGSYANSGMLGNSCRYAEQGSIQWPGLTKD